MKCSRKVIEEGLSSVCSLATRGRRHPLNNDTTDSCESGLLGSYDGHLWDLGAVPGRGGAKMVECQIALGSVKSSPSRVASAAPSNAPLVGRSWFIMPVILSFLVECCPKGLIGFLAMRLFPVCAFYDCFACCDPLIDDLESYYYVIGSGVCLFVDFPPRG